MLIYTYDGSFEGLLTAIYQAYYDRMPDRILPLKGLQLSFVDEYINIETESIKAAKVYSSIENRISSEALQMVYNVFLSNEKNVENIIFEYLKLGWRVGNKVNFHLSDDRVLTVNKTSYRVEHEVHKMTGFVRFRLIEGNIYYAPIEPDNNIVELLAPHFAERMSDQNWIIHDVKRNNAVVYNTSQWIIIRDALEFIPRMDKKDAEYQRLWKAFFTSISIVNRFNPKLQRQLMPARYWKHMTEKCELES